MSLLDGLPKVATRRRLIPRNAVFGIRSGVGTATFRLVSGGHLTEYAASQPGET